MRINNIFSKIKNTSKKTFMIMMVPLVSVAIAGLVTNAALANEVLLEGNTKALNVTKGETTYQDSTNALVDEVVQVQLWYHNRELPTGAQAKNTRVKFTVPSAKGKKQIITGTTSADNANTITDTTDVNLSLDRSYVEYIPGTAKWRYNKAAMDGDKSCQTGMEFPADRCYVTVPISDDVVKNPQGVNLGTTPGCNAYHATVTIQVRVKADVVSVNKYVRHKGQGADAWKIEANAKPGDDLEYLIRFKNEGNTVLKDVMVGDNLPKFNSYVDNTTWLQNGAFPNGTKLTNNNITKGGINVGNYEPGAVGYVWFQAKLDPIAAYEKCGVYDIRNVGVVRPAGMNEFYNTAIVKINVECQEVEPKFACEALDVRKVNRTNFIFTATGSAQNANITGYIFSLNGQTVQDSAKNVYDFSNTQPGEYTVTVIVKTDKGNTTVTDKCTKKITVEDQPEEPVFACDLLTLKKLDGRKIRLNVLASASGGAEIKRYIYNFGDGSEELTTDKSSVEHTYKKDGSYTSSVKVVVEVNGETQTVTSNSCAASIKFAPEKEDECIDKPSTEVDECNPEENPETPKALPNTGPGAIVATFFTVTSLSSALYFALVRRFSNL